MTDQDTATSLTNATVLCFPAIATCHHGDSMLVLVVFMVVGGITASFIVPL